MDEEATDPVRTQSPQNVVLRSDEDRVTQLSVVSRLLDLPPRFQRQAHLVFVLDVPTA